MDAVWLLEALLVIEVGNELFVRPVIPGLVARNSVIFDNGHDAAVRQMAVHRMVVDMVVNHPAAGIIATQDNVVALARSYQHCIRVDRRR